MTDLVTIIDQDTHLLLITMDDGKANALTMDMVSEYVQPN
jgi:enoyl-CoA hydratase/carnithine racemase